MQKIVEKCSVSGLLFDQKVTRLEFSEGINVIYGFNGKGKTSVLRLINSALKGKADDILDIPFYHAVIDGEDPIFLEKYRRQLRRAGYNNDFEHPKAFNDIDYDDDYDMDNKSFSDKDKINIEIEPSYMTDIPIQCSFLEVDRIFKRNLRTNSIERERFTRAIRLMWSEYNNRILSETKRLQEQTYIEQLLNYDMDNLTAEGDLSHIYVRLKRYTEKVVGDETFDLDYHDFSQRYHADRYYRSMINRIDDIEQVSENQEKTKNRLLTILADLMNNKSIKSLRNNIEISSNDRRVNLDNLSSGEKHLLFILVNTVLVDNGLLLIDEPELSMHVDWQRKLIDIMKELNPKAQIIMATHSPEIYSRAKRSGNIVRIDK